MLVVPRGRNLLVGLAVEALEVLAEMPLVTPVVREERQEAQLTSTSLTLQVALVEPTTQRLLVR
jgi:hypothetical protein